ncbi:hypothetical protein H920_12211 [Fukomys damarensis]|uniref:Uncharacterized protein n=1 Tax=Fukomys damarensis TaxID=885580 RepID=A0A091D2U4_FUKDA|nr:hypothetical protein H920_12211 [Fukomys damarensis]
MRTSGSERQNNVPEGRSVEREGAREEPAAVEPDPEPRQSPQMASAAWIPFTSSLSAGSLLQTRSIALSPAPGDSVSEKRTYRRALGLRRAGRLSRVVTCVVSSTRVRASDLSSRKPGGRLGCSQRLLPFTQ